MDTRNHRTAFFIIMMALFLLGMGFVSLAKAQEGGEATAVPPPTPEPTPIPTAVPILNGAVSENVSEALSTISVQDIIEVVVSVAVIILVTFYIGKLLYRLLERVARRSKYKLDDQLLELIRPQISWFLLALGFQFATARLDFLSDSVKQFLQSVYFILYLVVVLATVWRAYDFLIDWYITNKKEKMNENLVKQLVPLIKRLGHLTLILIALVVAASYFGIDILALSAALGLGGFALALSAKDTITNIISGFVLMVSQPFKVGDRIDVTDLSSWGDVVDIGIRSTTVQMRDNRLVIVPNSSIVDNAVVNYSRPDNSYRLQSDIGIGYDVDIPKAQQLIKETVRTVDGILPDKPVDVWFTEFGDSSMTFRVRWWVPTYANKRRSTDSVNAVIQQMAVRENIDMPNPTYTLENKFVLSDEDFEKMARAVKAPK